MGRKPKAPRGYGVIEEYYELPPPPNIDNLVIEDGAPLDSFFSEKQYRLLTEPLYSSWPGPGKGRPFLVGANVGLIFTPKEPVLAPDVMLAVDVKQPSDFS